MTKRTQRPTRAVAYRRVSTDEQANSGAGLDAQEAKIAAHADSKGWTLVDIFTDAGVSGGTAIDAREALNGALAMLAGGEADVLVVAKLDRLTRRIGVLSELLDRAEAEGWQVVILDADVDTTTAGGRLVANVLGSVAEWERSVIRERTRDALAARKARGMRLGRPVTLPADVRQRIATERANGSTLQSIADSLNDEGVPTARGGKWRPSTIAAVLRSLEFDGEARRAGEKAPVAA